jgi:hypothetical protein
MQLQIKYIYLLHVSLSAIGQKPTSCSFAGPLAAFNCKRSRSVTPTEQDVTAELDAIAVANPIAARDAADGRTHEVAGDFRGGNWSVVATVSVPKQRGRRGKNVRGVEHWVTHAVGIVGAQRMEEDAVAASARARQRDHPPAACHSC